MKLYIASSILKTNIEGIIREIIQNLYENNEHFDESSILILLEKTIANEIESEENYPIYKIIIDNKVK